MLDNCTDLSKLVVYSVYCTQPIILNQTTFDADNWLLAAIVRVLGQLTSEQAQACLSHTNETGYNLYNGIGFDGC
jgi:hypothetical protein